MAGTEPVLCRSMHGHHAVLQARHRSGDEESGYTGTTDTANLVDAYA